VEVVGLLADLDLELLVGRIIDPGGYWAFPLSIDSSGPESREAASESGEEVVEGGIVIAPLYGVPGIGGAIGRSEGYGKLRCGLCQSE
jgi:hypothetical protein